MTVTANTMHKLIHDFFVFLKEYSFVFFPIFFSIYLCYFCLFLYMAAKTKAGMLPRLFLITSGIVSFATIIKFMSVFG